MKGKSVFVQDDGGMVRGWRSVCGVGADVMLITYRLLGLTPLGRRRDIKDWP